MTKPRIGLLYTTQDRYELTYMAITTALKDVDTIGAELTLLWSMVLSP